VVKVSAGDQLGRPTYVLTVMHGQPQPV